MATTMYTDNVEILGSEDKKQLVVRADGAQAEALQEWQAQSGEALAQVTASGQVRLGTDLAQSSPSALLEVSEELPLSAEVKQGFQTSGVFEGGIVPITDPLTWSVHEMTLEGSGGLEGLQTAVRTRLTQRNTGSGANAELRVGDFQVTNEGGSSGSPVEHAAALHGAVDNQENGYLNKGVAVEAALHNADGAEADTLSAFEVAPIENEGTINTLHGLYVPDINAGSEANYAIYTNEGVVHLGDMLEVHLPSTTPATPAQDNIHIYPKSDGKLYARNWEGQEYDLTDMGSGLSPDLGKIIINSYGGFVRTSEGGFVGVL